MGQVNSASTTVYSEEPKNQTALHRAEYAAQKTLRGRHGRPPCTHSRHARLRYSVVVPTPSELCLADGAAERSDGRAVELPISVRGLRPSWTLGRRTPRLRARSSWRRQTLGCGCLSSSRLPYVCAFELLDSAARAAL